MVSPGATPVALTVRRLAVPTAPSAIDTVPDETVCVAVVELVKVAKVPRPATLAAAASTASETSSLTESLCMGEVAPRVGVGDRGDARSLHRRRRGRPVSLDRGTEPSRNAECRPFCGE